MTTDNTTRHSPGPYFYERDRDGCDDLWRIVSQTTQSTVAHLVFWDGEDSPEKVARTEANARLLAAAPDMFEALKELAVAFDRLDITVTEGPLFLAFRSARHAIALADGTLSYRAC
ncbi:MAG: hypothetical protein IT449_00070 [Phycisphaerales bacterium]|nr:hypothetical protein [Phycisphaerales bacterium]